MASVSTNTWSEPHNSALHCEPAHHKYSVASMPYMDKVMSGRQYQSFLCELCGHCVRVDTGPGVPAGKKGSGDGEDIPF